MLTGSADQPHQPHLIKHHHHHPVTHAITSLELYDGAKLVLSSRSISIKQLILLVGSWVGGYCFCRFIEHRWKAASSNGLPTLVIDYPGTWNVSPPRRAVSGSCLAVIVAWGSTARTRLVMIVGTVVYTGIVTENNLRR